MARVPAPGNLLAAAVLVLEGLDGVPSDFGEGGVLDELGGVGSGPDEVEPLDLVFADAARPAEGEGVVIEDNGGEGDAVDEPGDDFVLAAVADAEGGKGFDDGVLMEVEVGVGHLSCLAWLKEEDSYLWRES